MRLFLDTHVLIWLFQREKKPFSRRALSLIDSAEIFLPAISIIELQFLFEIGKLLIAPQDIIDNLQESVSLLKMPADIHKIIDASMTLNWTRDPFDRLIVAEAIIHKACLLTKDRNIRAYFEDALW